MDVRDLWRVLCLWPLATHDCYEVDEKDLRNRRVAIAFERHGDVQHEYLYDGMYWHGRVGLRYTWESVCALRLLADTPSDRRVASLINMHTQRSPALWSDEV